MTRTAAAIVAGVAAVVAAASSCGRSEGPALECQRDEQCGVEHACVAGACLPIATPPPNTAIELAPLSTSPSGLVELTKIPPAPVKLVAPDKVTLTGTVAPEAGGAPLRAAHLVLSVLAEIPGRPDLRFETDLVPATGGATEGTFGLVLPAGLMGHLGTLSVLPRGPEAFTHAPATLAVTVDPTLNLIVPSKSFTVQGRLTTAGLTPKSGQIVRAFQGSELVSTVDVTTDDGTFSIAVPAARVGPSSTQAITVELAPPEGAIEPSLVTKPISVTANVDLGDVRLPAFSQPNVFRFAIHAGTDSGPTVPATIVQARTRLADDAMGTTTFVRESVTSDKGTADLELLPGASTALRSYDVAIVPPTDSPYATRCISKLPVASGGTGAVPAILPSVVLQRRTKVTMTVLSGDGRRPAANLMVVATLTEPDPSLMSCAGEVTTRPPTATTDARGVFSLLLDPGKYRFDFDPPPGSAEPRFSLAPEDGFPPVAPGAAAEVKITTAVPPVALVAEGTALDARARPIPLASIRLFQLTCGATAQDCTLPASAPILRAQARTDADGHYRAIFTVP